MFPLSFLRMAKIDEREEKVTQQNTKTEKSNKVIILLMI